MKKNKPTYQNETSEEEPTYPYQIVKINEKDHPINQNMNNLEV